MSYLLAPLALGALCVVWYLVQRASGNLETLPCERAGESCDGCQPDAPSDDLEPSCPVSHPVAKDLTGSATRRQEVS